MSELARPHPEPTPETRHFWESLQRGELTGQRCHACGSVRVYPLARCRDCLDSGFDYVALSGRGWIYTYTVIHRAPLPAFADSVPYVLASIELDEGGHLLAEVVSPAAGVSIGGRVRLALDAHPVTLVTPRFVLLGDGGQGGVEDVR